MIYASHQDMLKSTPLSYFYNYIFSNYSEVLKMSQRLPPWGFSCLARRVSNPYSTMVAAARMNNQFSLINLQALFLHLWSSPYNSWLGVSLVTGNHRCVCESIVRKKKKKNLEPPFVLFYFKVYTILANACLWQKLVFAMTKL